MAFRIRRKLSSDSEFLALPPEVREVFIVVFRELAVSKSPRLRGQGYFIEELRQRQKIAPEGIFSVHVTELPREEWFWRGAFFRRRSDLVFFGFGPRFPDFYVRMARARAAMSRVDDER
ncbi:MAG: hypothetical protein ACHQ2Y_00095 [Candidatus Lutacidiplasmatales archaeon]